MSSIKRTVIDEVFLNFPKSRLSEGPTYNPLDNSFLWVDIIAGEVHRVFLPIGTLEYTAKQLQEIKDSHEVVKVPDSVGVIGLTSNPDVYIAGCQRGVGFVDFNKGSFQYKVEYPAESHNEKYRSNDGAIDHLGNFWVGTISNFGQPGSPSGGSLYRVNTDFSIDTLLSECKIPNGIAFYEGKFYWTDSLTFTIWKFDYNEATGEITNREPHIKIKDYCSEFESPEPDGFAMATNGDIYTAVFSTSKVLRFNIKGELVEEFIFPAKRITCPVFGGENLDTLFVTSADLHLDDIDKVDSAQPLDFGGAIFRVVLDGVQGLPKNVWTGALE